MLCPHNVNTAWNLSETWCPHANILAKSLHWRKAQCSSKTLGLSHRGPRICKSINGELCLTVMPNKKVRGGHWNNLCQTVGRMNWHSHLPGTSYKQGDVILYVTLIFPPPRGMTFATASAVSMSLWETLDGISVCRSQTWFGQDVKTCIRHAYWSYVWVRDTCIKELTISSKCNSNYNIKV